ncbi:MAG TPA: helix-turn-helix transcriptional regulator [Pyrinomonadaceae bacterium]|nr:helix-turn-helix transcriptional regulator [Pyrinomonadaceae bacterium]
MIETKIRELAEAKGITTAYQLQKAAGLSPSMAARLFRDEVEMIALRTIESLCGAFECQPGDLFTAPNGKSKAKAKKAHQ